MDPISLTAAGGSLAERLVSYQQARQSTQKRLRLAVMECRANYELLKRLKLDEKTGADTLADELDLRAVPPRLHADAIAALIESGAVDSFAMRVAGYLASRANPDEHDAVAGESQLIRKLLRVHVRLRGMTLLAATDPAILAPVKWKIRLRNLRDDMRDIDAMHIRMRRHQTPWRTSLAILRIGFRAITGRLQAIEIDLPRFGIGSGAGED